MKKRIKKLKLNVKTSHSNLLKRGLLSSLLKSTKVRTNLRRAKALKSFSDKEISYCVTLDEKIRKEKLQSRYGNSEVEAQMLKYCKFINGVYPDRRSGFTRITKIGFRAGDNSEIAEVTLVDSEDYLKQIKAELAKTRKATKKAPKAKKKPTTATKKEVKPVKKAGPKQPVEKSVAPGREGFLEKIRNRILGRKIQAPEIHKQKGRVTTRGGI